MTADDDEVLLARAYLSRVAEPACLPVCRLVRERGAVEAATAIRAGEVQADIAAATEARRLSADPHADLEAAARHGVRLVVPESDEWPHFAFAALEATGRARLRSYDEGNRTQQEGGDPVPPLALWAQGDADLTSAAVRSVALVGARAASGYGEHVTAQLSYGLARRGVMVVSGGAYGIDAAAHRAALAADGVTVLVSAGGLDRPYPAGNARLYEQAAATGLVLSESPPGSAPQRHRFLSRNRLIAALSTGTVVVEAAARSGALNTARHARTIGRPVMAVPGPVTSTMSVGCHDLLRAEISPALLVTSVDDVLVIVGSVGEAEAMHHASTVQGGVGDGTGGELRGVLDRLDPIARRVFDGLSAGRPVREDELALRSGVSPVEVIRALPALRLAGLVEGSDDGFRIIPELRRAGRRSRPPPSVLPAR